jgi:hypothetical protein
MEKERIAVVLASAYSNFETQRVSHDSRDRCNNIDTFMMSGIQTLTNGSFAPQSYFKLQSSSSHDMHVRS